MLLDDDSEGKALSELVGTLAWSGSVNAVHFGQQPRFGSVNLFEMFLWSSSHKLMI